MNESFERNLRGFGERIRRQRELLGWSQQRVVDALKENYGLQFTQVHISKLERGHKNAQPSTLLLLALADLYGVSIDFLLGRTEEPAAILAEQETHYLTAEAEVVAEVVDQLQSRHRSDVLAIVRALASTEDHERISQRVEMERHARMVARLLGDNFGPNAVQAYAMELARTYPDLWDRLFGAPGPADRIAQ